MYKTTSKPIYKKNYKDSNYDWYEVHHVTVVIRNGKEETFDTVYTYYTKTKQLFVKDRVYPH